ncbi:MAG: LysR family transcriptional regulator [Hyphomonadaceae bacterium]|nr:LysR family transcriptional regulator [Hyphomonadaceae bacterium]
MDRLDRLRTFLLIADKASFAEAARSLQISATAASRAIASLEEELGASLFYRTTRSVRLTPEGAAYRERVRLALDALEDAAGAISGEDANPRGTLVVTAPVVLGRMHVAPVVSAMLAAHADLSARLLFTDRLTRLAEEGVDIAIRIGPLADSALHTVKIAETTRVLVASPTYLAAHGEPRTLADLKSHALVAFDNFTLGGEWRFKSGSVAVTPRLLTNDVAAAMEAAINGLGLVHLLSYQTNQEAGLGKLVRVLRNEELAAVPISAVFQANRQRSANVRAFLSAMRLQLHKAAL